MALTGYIKVTTAELTAQAQTVSSELQTMNSLFDDLGAKLNTTEQYWIGSAGDTHRGDYRNQLKRVTEILARYTEHVNDLRQMAGVYDTAEQQASSLAEELPTSTL